MKNEKRAAFAKTLAVPAQHLTTSIKTTLDNKRPSLFKGKKIYTEYGGFIEYGPIKVNIPSLDIVVPLNLSNLENSEGLSQFSTPEKDLISKPVTIQEYHYDKDGKFIIDKAVLSSKYKNKTTYTVDKNGKKTPISEKRNKSPKLLGLRRHNSKDSFNLPLHKIRRRNFGSRYNGR